VVQLPKLSEEELAILHNQPILLSDIFLQGLALCLFGEREDGFHKACSAMRRTYEDDSIDEQFLQQNFNRLLKQLARGNVSAWKNLAKMAGKKDTPVRQVIRHICPLEVNREGD